MEKEQQKPVFEHRLGSIRVTVWENTDKEGNTFYNTALVRRYQSGSGEWSNSSSFTGLSDLALLGEALELARTWIRSHSLGQAGEVGL